MRTLTLNNTWKNLTLVAVGALMATMIAVPLTGSVSADSDDDPSFHPTSAKVTYSITGSNGLSSTFELIERDGQTVLALVVNDTPASFNPEDED